MKKIVLIVVPVLVVLIGGVLAAAMTGRINIPGLTPKKAKPALYGEQPEEPAPLRPPVIDEPEEAEPPAPTVQPASTSDPERGAKRLARIWNDIEIDALTKIAEKYSDDDVARVVVNMDGEKASELIARLGPDRGAAISRAIERNASRVPRSD